MSTTTLSNTKHRVGEPLAHALHRTVTGLMRWLNALDRSARERYSSTDREAAQLLRLAESYESSQPSYAADLRAAATLALGDPPRR